MTNAYPECYLKSAKRHLAQCFDYAVNSCQVDGALFLPAFAQSHCAALFERGNPWVTSGMDGIELAQRVLVEKMPHVVQRDSPWTDGRSAQYWIGWVLAEYQWTTALSFRRILAIADYDRLLAMYPVYHQMDVSAFVRDMLELAEVCAREQETRLKQLRVSSGLSQSQLARAAEVNLRSIQMYEQRKNDINKAQGATLYRISRVLGCTIEDLLEDEPSSCVHYAFVSMNEV